jgi:flagella basal body P-ring formation protein FlgA
MITALLTIVQSLAVIAAPAASAAADSEAHENILATARGFLETQVGSQHDKYDIRLGALDARLRLAACERPLEGFMGPGARIAGNTSVGVACTGTHPWKLYVQAYVAVYKTVAVAATYLAAGTALGEDNIRLEERDVTAGGYGYVSDLGQLSDSILKQPVQDGQIIPPQALTRAKLIRRGDAVVILSKNGNIEVRMSGSALMDGAAGDRIKVKNEKSKRVIEGKVEAPGLVMVSM